MLHLCIDDKEMCQKVCGTYRVVVLLIKLLLFFFHALVVAVAVIIAKANILVVFTLEPK